MPFIMPPGGEAAYFSNVFDPSEIATPIIDIDLQQTNAARRTTAQAFVSASSQYFETGKNTELTGDIDLSITGWVYVTSTGANQVIFSKWDYSSSNRVFRLLINSSGQLSFSVSGDGGTATTVTTTATVSTGTWYFVRAWHDKTANEIGVQLNNGTKATAAHTTGLSVENWQFAIGCSYGPAPTLVRDPLNGRIDELAVWTGVVDDTLATALYNGGAGLAYGDLTTAQKTNLSSWWGMDAGGSTLEDMHGSRDMTRYGPTLVGGHVYEPSPNGDPVERIDDNSGNANNGTQAFSTLMPTYNAVGVNSNPGVEFDGSDDAISFLDALSIQNSATHFTAFIALDLTLSLQNDTIFRLLNGASAARVEYGITTVGNQQRQLKGRRLDADSESTLTSTASNIAGGVAIEAVTVDWVAGTASIWRNGVKIGSGSFGTGGGNTQAADLSVFEVGSSAGATAPMILGRFWATDQGYTDYEMQMMSKYLMVKWGISL